VDNFSSHFSFYQADHSDNETKATHLCKLNDIVLNTLFCSNSIIVIADTYIKNNVATSIAYIYLHSNLIRKTLHHAISVTSSEAKLFTIRCGINQAIQFHEVSHIIVITNSIHVMQ